MACGEQGEGGILARGSCNDQEREGVSEQGTAEMRVRYGQSCLLTAELMPPGLRPHSLKQCNVSSESISLCWSSWAIDTLDSAKPLACPICHLLLLGEAEPLPLNKSSAGLRILFHLVRVDMVWRRQMLSSEFGSSPVFASDSVLSFLICEMRGLTSRVTCGPFNLLQAVLLQIQGPGPPLYSGRSQRLHPVHKGSPKSLVAPGVR